MPTDQQLERRRLRGEAMAEWIGELGGSDEAVVTMTVAELKRIATCGAAICGHPTANLCGVLLKRLVSNGEEPDTARQVGERLNLIR